MKKLIFMSLCLLLFLASPVMAVPVEVIFTDNPTGQDPLGPPISDELGRGFPQPDKISASDDPCSYIPCPRDYTGGENVRVTMTNLTDVSWWNVMYVADPETSITNDDLKLVNGCLAFLIDWDIPGFYDAGLNKPLVRESIARNNIFEPGETWCFVIQNYSNTFLLAASAFRSYDAVNNRGLVGNQSIGDLVSSGSIIAVPEPATIMLLGLGGLALLRRRKH